MSDIFKCILHKLKTGCQWKNIFVDIEGFKPPFSWNTVYYFYRKWGKENVFETIFSTFLELQEGKINQENLNLDGTHSLVKKSAESAAYQHRKKAKTSNVLILTDGNGIPIAIGNILSGNHNDLYADKGFDSKSLRRACHRRKIVPNIIENSKNRKKTKRGRKRFFSQKVYDNRFVNERAFAWIDSFRTLLIRFDKLDNVWLNWHYLAFSLILLKV